MNDKDKQKKLLAYVGVTTMMVLLGVVAVVTAWKLRQTAQEPIAPTAPQSRPKASEPTEAPSDVACITQYSISESSCRGWCDDASDCEGGYVCDIEEGDSSGLCMADTEDCEVSEQDASCSCPEPEVVSCQSKEIYKDVDGNEPGKYNLDDENKLSVDDTVRTDEQLVYMLTLVSADASGLAAISDQLPAEMEFVDAVEECDESDSTPGKIVCDYEGSLPKELAYRVKMKNIVAEKDLSNKADVVDGNGNESSCAVTVKVVPPGPTSTPTPTVTSTPTPTGTGTPAPTATGTPDPTATGTPDPTATGTPAPTVTPTPRHLACVDESCSWVAGSGENLCDEDADCVKETHLACISEACQAVDGGGADLCTTDADCARATHLACLNQACQSVDGGGSNRCSSDADCIQPTPYPTVEPSSLPAAGVLTPTIGVIALGGILLLAGLAGLLVW